MRMILIKYLDFQVAFATGFFVIAGPELGTRDPDATAVLDLSSRPERRRYAAVYLVPSCTCSDA